MNLGLCRATGDINEWRKAYANFHPKVRATRSVQDHYQIGAIRERSAACLVGRRVTLLGDAGDPTMPFMTHGACIAIENAVVLAERLTA